MGVRQDGESAQIVNSTLEFYRTAHEYLNAAAHIMARAGGNHAMGLARMNSVMNHVR